PCNLCLFLFFSLLFNHTAPPYIYTLSLHDALPISYSAFIDVLLKMEDKVEFGLKVLWERDEVVKQIEREDDDVRQLKGEISSQRDRKSTRLNSSHVEISYAVFCLKKKKKKNNKKKN